MRLQVRYRSMVLVALAISLLAIAGFPQTAWAGNANANNARSEQAAERRQSAPGQERKAEQAPAEETPDAGDNPEGPTTHAENSAPGGQGCDEVKENNFSGNGANDQTDNDYANTCVEGDPNAAPNGAGDGNATGKPCAGCVGAADDKNPPGQADNGPEDQNNGYECDQKNRGPNEGNNGVGFGNPAHTGCQPDVDGCVPVEGQDANCNPICVPKANQNADCTEKCVPKAGQNADCTEKCVPKAGQNADCTEPCVAGRDAACSQVTPTCVESATNRCGGAPAAVLGETLGRLDVLGVSVEAPAGAVAPAALARTGGFQLTALVQMAIALAMVGLGLTLTGRRRQTVDIERRLAGD